MRTLIQRVGLFPGKIDFLDMGAPEYTSGSSDVALNLMACNVGDAHEVIPTNIRIRHQDVDRFIGQNAERTERFSKMTDGQPLVMRIVPEICKRDTLKAIATQRSLEDLENVGDLLCESTAFWICLNPAVGVLYHPSQEENVMSFLAYTREMRQRETPNTDALAIRILRQARADTQCKLDVIGVIDLMEDAQKRQTPLRRVMAKITRENPVLDTPPWDLDR